MAAAEAATPSIFRSDPATVSTVRVGPLLIALEMSRTPPLAMMVPAPEIAPPLTVPAPLSVPLLVPVVKLIPPVATKAAVPDMTIELPPADAPLLIVVVPPMVVVPPDSVSA